MTLGNFLAILILALVYLAGAALRTYRLGKPTFPFKKQ